MVLHHAETLRVETISKTMQRIPGLREDTWTETQKELQKQRIRLKQAKAMRIQACQKLLLECKTWSGPCTSVEDLRKILHDRSNMAVYIVRQELSFFIDRLIKVICHHNQAEQHFQ